MPYSNIPTFCRRRVYDAYSRCSPVMFVALEITPLVQEHKLLYHPPLVVLPASRERFLSLSSKRGRGYQKLVGVPSSRARIYKLGTN